MLIPQPNLTVTKYSTNNFPFIHIKHVMREYNKVFSIVCVIFSFFVEFSFKNKISLLFPRKEETINMRYVFSHIYDCSSVP